MLWRMEEQVNEEDSAPISVSLHTCCMFLANFLYHLLDGASLSDVDDTSHTLRYSVFRGGNAGFSNEPSLPHSAHAVLLLTQVV